MYFESIFSIFVVTDIACSVIMLLISLIEKTQLLIILVVTVVLSNNYAASSIVPLFTTSNVGFNLHFICRRLFNIARSKKLREQQGKVVLEGKCLVCSALDAGAIAQTVYFSSVDALRELPSDKLRNTSIVKVRMEDPKVWSDLDISQDIIGKKM